MAYESRDRVFLLTNDSDVAWIAEASGKILKHSERTDDDIELVFAIYARFADDRDVFRNQWSDLSKRHKELYGKHIQKSNQYPYYVRPKNNEKAELFNDVTKNLFDLDMDTANGYTLDKLRDNVVSMDQYREVA